MTEVYIVDYAVIDTLGLDIVDNYKNMPTLAKGPQTVTRYDPTTYPNILCTRGYEISFYETENILTRLQNDLVSQLSSRHTFPSDTAVIFGCFPTSGYAIRQPFNDALENGNSRFSPTKLFMNNNDLISASVSRKLGLEGFSTSLNAACSTSMFNLHYAFTCIQNGTLSSALVGALETPIWAQTQYYWQSTGAISNTDGGICRPFDKSRDGFVQAEGGTLWYICDKETVEKYGLKPKAKLLSIAAGAKCHDTASMTAHDKTGKNQVAIINRALRDASKTPSDMAFFNAHATST